MKLHQNLLAGAGVLSLLLLTGCIDDKYDLANVDTTSEIKVKDLVLPVNLDPVVLSDIIKVEEGDQLKEVTLNGHTFYAVEQSGTFSSDGIDVNGFTAEPQDMQPKTATFKPNRGGMESKRKAGESFEFYYLMEPVDEVLSYKADGIDGSLRSLTEVFFEPLTFRMELSTTSLPSTMESEIQDILLYLPKGLNVTALSANGQALPTSYYTPQTGAISIPSITMKDNAALIEVQANFVNLMDYDEPFKYNPATDTGSFDLESVFNLESGSLRLSGLAQDLASIEEINYFINYELGALHATSVVGSIAYTLEGTGLEIEPIELDNLPDFLDDPETNLIISNPQIYLNLTNPIGEYGLGFESSIDIIAYRDGGKTLFESPLVEVPGNPGTFNYLLSPVPGSVTNVPSEYEKDLQRLTYPNLGHILSGDGLPEKLDIKLVDPRIPEKKVSKPFLIGTTIDGMEGSYMFLAPLSLKEGSLIVKTIDGWWSEDLADLTINLLKISATASSDIPMEVLLTVYPIDKDGKRIETSTDSTVKLPALAEGQKLELVMEGDITNLDGIEIYVMAASNDEDALEPSQVITLDDIKAKVTGYYKRKL